MRALIDFGADPETALGVSDAQVVPPGLKQVGPAPKPRLGRAVGGKAQRSHAELLGSTTEEEEFLKHMHVRVDQRVAERAAHWEAKAVVQQRRRVLRDAVDIQMGQVRTHCGEFWLWPSDIADE